MRDSSQIRSLTHGHRSHQMEVSHFPHERYTNWLEHLEHLEHSLVHSTGLFRMGKNLEWHSYSNIEILASRRKFYDNAERHRYSPKVQRVKCISAAYIMSSFAHCVEKHAPSLHVSQLNGRVLGLPISFSFHSRLLIIDTRQQHVSRICQIFET